MSGCHHPTVSGNSARIRVTPIEFKYIESKQKAIVTSKEHFDLKIGDQVELYECSIREERPTGRTLIRYVSATVLEAGFLDDDNFIFIHLVPLKSMIETLQTS